MSTRSRVAFKGLISSERVGTDGLGPIVKVETTGLNPKEDRVIAVGTLSNAILTVVRAPQHDDDPTFGLTEYHRYVREWLARSSSVFYAYNAQFDRDFLVAEFDLPSFSIDWRDLLAPFARAADKLALPYPRLDQLVSIPQDIDAFRPLRSAMLPRGPDIPTLWRQYRELDDTMAIEAIVEHLRSSLLREQLLLSIYGAAFFEPPEVAP